MTNWEDGKAATVLERLAIGQLVQFIAQSLLLLFSQYYCRECTPMANGRQGHSLSISSSHLEHVRPINLRLRLQSSQRRADLELAQADFVDVVAVSTT